MDARQIGQQKMLKRSASQKLMIAKRQIYSNLLSNDLKRESPQETILKELIVPVYRPYFESTP